ncbi:hypothetical protein BGY98DRAFT_83497 [Russula aff. rugulosa BPL654]|nr:hypothetical protein BGY98DRAFT_221736 [Russula aff. rugulosa BPL654]KAI0274242.1 hypothetical protein BGY98DRAFT_83497 [Russula aff. rugulosa BPL654]
MHGGPVTVFASLTFVRCQACQVRADHGHGHVPVPGDQPRARNSCSLLPCLDAAEDPNACVTPSSTKKMHLKVLLLLTSSPVFKSACGPVACFQHGNCHTSGVFLALT